MALLPIVNLRNISVLGKSVTVSLIEPNAFTKTNQLGESCLKASAINIAGNMPVCVIQETILHEIIHLLDRNLMLELTEKQVSAVSASLFCVMRENPELFKEFIAD